MTPQPMETEGANPSYELTESHQKRKRSISMDRALYPTPRTKVPKSHHGSSGQIDYLSRKYSDSLPLVSIDAPLESILSLLSDYEGVLQRHESFAFNLGAKPLGPILMKKFERLFDGPPRILKSHGKEGTMVTWQDVVDFAEQKPEQFNLDKWRDGLRVCQIYTKQTRVEISEEDYLLIASKLPMKMMPTQPIAEDEEKELGTVEIIEGKLGQIVQLADQVEARARQLNHRIKLRKSAIIHRREQEEVVKMEMHHEDSTPAGGIDRGSIAQQSNGDDRAGVSPTSGFVAVNSRPSSRIETSFYENGDKEGLGSLSRRPDRPTLDRRSVRTATSATKAELMKCFSTHLAPSSGNDVDPSQKSSSINPRSFWASKTKGRPNSEVDSTALLNQTGSPVPIPHTPSNLVHVAKPSPADRSEDSGPHKQEMLARMEQLNRGDRVLPPCDRCRRLHMDCLKNLTACQGCTKKHAKCSWKDVSDQELIDHPFISRAEREKQKGSPHNNSERSVSPNATAIEPEDPLRPVRDEELLGEDASDESDSSSSQIAHDEQVGGRSSSTVKAGSHSVANSELYGHRPQEALACALSPAMAVTTHSSTPKAQTAFHAPHQDTAAAAIQELTSKPDEDFGMVEERFFQQVGGSSSVAPVAEMSTPTTQLHSAEKMILDLQASTQNLMQHDAQQIAAQQNGHVQTENGSERQLWSPSNTLTANTSTESNLQGIERNGEKQLEHWSGLTSSLQSVNGSEYLQPFDRLQHTGGMNG